MQGRVILAARPGRSVSARVHRGEPDEPPDLDRSEVVKRIHVHIEQPDTEVEVGHERAGVPGARIGRSPAHARSQRPAAHDPLEAMSTSTPRRRRGRSSGRACRRPGRRTSPSPPPPLAPASRGRPRCRYPDDRSRTGCRAIEPSITGPTTGHDHSPAARAGPAAEDVSTTHASATGRTSFLMSGDARGSVRRAP